MDKITDIVGNIKKRLSSPFIFSFLLSWLVVNWKITVALLWFNPDQIKRAGYTSIFDLISCQLGSASYRWPIITAIGYTILWPFISSFFSWIRAIANRWGESLVRRASQETRISAKRYFKLKAEYDAQLKVLQQNIDAESDIKNELQSKTTELLKVETQNIELAAKHSQEISVLSERLTTISKQKDDILNDYSRFTSELTNMNFMNGLWDIQYMANGRREEYRIRNGLMVDSDPTKQEHYRIDLFYHDIQRNEIAFVKYPITLTKENLDEKDDTSTTVIRYKEEPVIAVKLTGQGDNFEGSENQIEAVRYIRNFRH